MKRLVVLLALFVLAIPLASLTGCEGGNDSDCDFIGRQCYPGDGYRCCGDIIYTCRSRGDSTYWYDPVINDPCEQACARISCSYTGVCSQRYDDIHHSSQEKCWCEDDLGYYESAP